MNARQAYTELAKIYREAAILSSTAAVLAWDKEVCMPPGGEGWRAEQLSLLAGMVHERMTSPRVRELLAASEGSELVRDPLSVEAVNIRELRRVFEKQARIPKRLVEEIAAAEVHSHVAWVEARQKNEFSIFKPWLEKMLGLVREKAQAYGYTTTPYDPLLDDFEPGMTTQRVSALFAELRRELVPLVEKIAQAPRKPNAGIISRRYPADRQRVFASMAAAVIGYDFNSGRLDTVVHPFCTTLGPDDIRITTRFDEQNFSEAFFGVIHESGHALYELGLTREQFGLPAGQVVSLGIHESQSRFWENCVGRSLAFWRYFYPQLRGTFPEALSDVSLEDFYGAVNTVEPSHIRTESDEVTYNLHIILRFEIEQALVKGELAVGDAPAAWNEKFKAMFGIPVRNDREGILQDIHWSMGSFGYFPTYCLGNMYAAQFFAQAHRELGDLDSQIGRGEFAPLLGWLRKKIHSQGMRYMGDELVKHVTGQPLSPQPLMNYLRSKFLPIYGM